MDIDWMNKPGIVVISRADYDGWPIGMPFAHVGPFANYAAYREWAEQRRTVFDRNHYSWQSITTPEDYVE